MTERKKWTEEDDSTIRNGVASGKTYAVIAEELSRSMASVQQRAMKLGLSKRGTDKAAAKAAEPAPAKAEKAAPVKASARAVRKAKVVDSAAGLVVVRKSTACFKGIRVELQGNAEVTQVRGKLVVSVPGYEGTIEVSPV